MELWLWIILAALFFGPAAGDKIYPTVDEVRGTEGESVTLRCNYETTDDDVYLYWYRHHSDLQAPQFILLKGARSNSYEYIPDKRYESQTSRSSTELTIRKLTPEDTALYYCALEIGGYTVGYALLFGKGIRLKVQPTVPPPVELFVPGPLQPDGVPLDQMVAEVCQKRTHPTAVTTTTPRTYAVETTVSYKLNDASTNNTKVDTCDDLQPEKAKLNFLLLLMNGVRVVFTKTVAFSTLLTIRAVFA